MLLGWRWRVQLVQSFFLCRHCMITHWEFEQPFIQKKPHTLPNEEFHLLTEPISSVWQLTFNFRCLYSVLLLTTKRAHSRRWCTDVIAPNGGDTGCPHKQKTYAQKWQNSLCSPNQDYPTDLSLLAFPLSPRKVLLSIMFTNMYLSLEGFMAFLRSRGAHWHQEYVPKPWHGSVIEEFQTELKLCLSSPLDYSS